MYDKEIEYKSENLIDKLEKYQDLQNIIQDKLMKEMTNYNLMYGSVGTMLPQCESHRMDVLYFGNINRNIEHLNDPLCIDYDPSTYELIEHSRKKMGISYIVDEAGKFPHKPFSQQMLSDVLNTLSQTGVMITDPTRSINTNIQTFTTKL